MSGWLTRLDHPGETARLGPLEWRVLEAMWTRGASATVPDLHREFPGSAYSTIMTTMDRLFHKGLLHRVKRGRGYHYEPRISRQAFEASRASGALQAAIKAAAGTELSPLLTLFVDAVAEHPELLTQLEEAIRAKRAAIDDKPT
jgi:predicted transcriptional regulator